MWAQQQLQGWVNVDKYSIQTAFGIMLYFNFNGRFKFEMVKPKHRDLSLDSCTMASFHILGLFFMMLLLSK